MKNITNHIWIWLENQTLYKAVYNPTNCSFIVYNEYDEILLKHTGISSQQISKIEGILVRLGARNLNKIRDPFLYL
jgi:hypothetical protein